MSEVNMPNSQSMINNAHIIEMPLFRTHHCQLKWHEKVFLWGLILDIMTLDSPHPVLSYNTRHARFPLYKEDDSLDTPGGDM